MAVVPAGASVILRVSLARDLDASISQPLQIRAADVGAVATEIDQGGHATGRSFLTEAGLNHAQILDLDGRIIDSTPLLHTRPLVSHAQIAAITRAPLRFDRAAVPGFPGRARLLATLSRAPGGGRFVVVAGESLDERDEAVGKLSVLLAIGGPIALLLASAASYGVASSALRPVEDMRLRAAGISGERHGERLPVPPSRDEIRRLGKTLNEMLHRIDSAIVHERAFVANAGHELRTPLALLKTELELPLRGDHSAAELRAAIASAGEETDRLTQRAEDLLVVARSDQGKLTVHREPVLVRDLLDDVAARFATRARRDRWQVSVDSGNEVVVADRLRLEQALSNLMDNALCHGTGPVRLWARAPEGAMELHVTDGGPGPPADFLPEGFERFSRADPARHRGGAGLGLSVVRAVARAHGGDAYLQHLNGAGFDAWVSIPTLDGLL